MKLQATSYKPQAKPQAKSLELATCSLQPEACSLKRRTGFTLIEILVTVSILSVVLTITFGAMRMYDVSMSAANTKSYLSGEASKALNKMREELVESSLGRIIISQGVPITEPDEIVFQVPLKVLDVDQEIQWGDGDTSVGYYVKYLVESVNPNNPQLKRQILNNGGASAGQESVIANNITDLQLNLVNNSLNIDVVASRGAQRGIITGINNVRVSTSIDFRN